jgi:hypothetical protein
MLETGTDSALPQLREAYHACFEHEDGDIPGRLAAQNYLDHSTAIYHDEVIGIGFLPKLYDRDTLRQLDTFATTAHGILEKVTRRFLDDPAYRSLFGFSPLLERLICLPVGYETIIPIMRMDIFLDEETLNFHFCEFNTDGTSAMNEDREGANALTHSTTFARATQTLGFALKPQELFEGWVDEFLALYRSSAYAFANPAHDPLVAIVDYTSSATPYEFEEFRSRFEQRGLRCLICDIAHLEYQNGGLYGTDVDPLRFGTSKPQRIDAIYRRAVTGEILAELEAVGVGAEDVETPAIDAARAPAPAVARVIGAPAPAGGTSAFAGDGDVGGALVARVIGAPAPAGDTSVGGDVGARALVRAVSEQSVCMIGGFLTHVAHCKQLFTVLHLPETTAFLTEDERQFVRRHVPYTTRLDSQHIDLDAVKADKDHWIIKPEDGYASKGVHAGIDKNLDEWSELIDACSNQPYVVQTFCKQYATPNARPIPLDATGKRRFSTLDEWDASLPAVEATHLEPWNNLTGLYLYGGRFSGLFVRAGQKGIIAGFAGGITVPVFLANYHPDDALALRTRPIPGTSGKARAVDAQALPDKTRLEHSAECARQDALFLSPSPPPPSPSRKETDG